MKKENPHNGDNHSNIKSSDIKITVQGDILTVSLPSGHVMHITQDELKVIADGTIPAGLSEKLTGKQIKTLQKFVKEKEKQEEKNTKKKSKSDAKKELNVQLPAWGTVADAIKGKYRVRTIPEIGTDKENIYYFNGQIYERAEEIFKSEAHKLYIDAWKKILEITYDPDASEALIRMLRKGPSSGDINEVLNNIRRTTLTYDQMNPDSHIPFLNGLLNLKTRKLEPFSADLFFTYQVNSNLLDTYVTLRDTPLFNSLLNGVFYEPDIPMALSYAAYALRPDFPTHKTLFILGRERIGKGTFVRVIQGLMPKGSGSFSLSRILTGERFQFTGVEGKNLIVDSETKRKFRRGTVLDWSLFCNLFGGDIISVEPKGREAHDYMSRAKGIVLGNLPFVPVDSPPAVARILVVETRNERPKRVIPNLDTKILTNERDLIATLLIQIMFKLEDREFVFPGQLTDDATADILEQLADPVSNFVEEMTEYVEGAMVSVDEAYRAFTEWCSSKGIPLLKSQTFKKSFAKHYTKKRTGPRGKQDYVYIDCKIFSTEIELGIQNQLQVGYGVDTVKTQKISLSGERYRRIQHECTYLRVEKKDHVFEREKEKKHDDIHDVKFSALMLDTDKDCIGEPKIMAPSEHEPVSNLKQEFPKNDTSRPLIIKADPIKTDVRSEKYPMTEEDGKLIIDQLLNLGYQVDLNSGPDINRKYFKVGIPALSSLPADKREHLERIMEKEHFKLFNSGAFGVFWYVRPLADASEEGKS